MQRPLPDNTQHSQEPDIHVSGGIRTRDPSWRAAADTGLRQRSHWDKHLYGYSHRNCDNHEEDDDNNNNNNNDDDEDDDENNNNALGEERKLLLESVSAATWISLRTELVSGPIRQKFAISGTFVTVG